MVARPHPSSRKRGAFAFALKTVRIEEVQSNVISAPFWGSCDVLSPKDFWKRTNRVVRHHIFRNERSRRKKIEKLHVDYVTRRAKPLEATRPKPPGDSYAVVCDCRVDCGGS